MLNTLCLVELAAVSVMKVSNAPKKPTVAERQCDLYLHGRPRRWFTDLSLVAVALSLLGYFLAGPLWIAVAIAVQETYIGELVGNELTEPRKTAATAYWVDARIIEELRQE